MVEIKISTNMLMIFGVYLMILNAMIPISIISIWEMDQKSIQMKMPFLAIQVVDMTVTKDHIQITIKKKIIMEACGHDDLDKKVNNNEINFVESSQNR